MELRSKSDFEMAMKRIYAWLNREIIDRPPVRFSEHNAEYAACQTLAGRSWPDLKSRWFDAEYQVDLYVESIRGRAFYGETFPVFCPNLGPNVYAAFHGGEITFGEVTSWIHHVVRHWGDESCLKFSRENEYFKKIDELTRVALEKCSDRFLVGYTDLHGSLDCVADWRDPQLLCLDIFDCPENIQKLLALANEHFLPTFDYYDTILKQHGQPSVNWMGIPSHEKFHVPSCDFTANVSTENFAEFYLPSLLAEVKAMTHNVFHLDGKGMIRHLDRILEIPEIHAIQWVQGVGNDLPILQWLPLIKRIRAAGKSVLIDLQLAELEPFIAEMEPEGIYLCLAAPQEQQPDILKRLEKWK